MNKRINIGVSHEVYERLAKFGKFGESYSDVINRLLNELEKKN